MLSIALVVAPADVECLGWYHDRPKNDFALTDLKPSSQDNLFLEGDIDGVQYGADLSYLPQSGVGLFLVDPLTKTRTYAVVGWYQIGETNQWEANLSVHGPDLKRPQVLYGVRCFTQTPAP